MRVNVERIEAEKAVLAERVEDEAAERVTVVASITHERNFLLRQARSQRLGNRLLDLHLVCCSIYICRSSCSNLQNTHVHLASFDESTKAVFGVFI